MVKKANKSIWTTNIDARLAVIGVKPSRLQEAAGWSKTWWHQVRKKVNPTLRDAKLFGILLSVDWKTLLQVDPVTIMNTPVPDWDWLHFVGEMRDEIGFKDRSILPDSIPAWSEFESLVNQRAPASNIAAFDMNGNRIS